MLFVAMTIALRLTERECLVVADSTLVHASILRLISNADPEVGRSLHDQQRHKHFTLSIVESMNGSAMLRVCFMSPNALNHAHLLIDALMKDGSLNIGRSCCYVSGVTIENGVWSGVATWSDITAPLNGMQLQFCFVTPTAIAKRGDKGERYFSLLPAPIDVFSGLLRRWQAMDGPKLPDNLAECIVAGGCVVSNILSLRTIEFQTSERMQIGFVGTVVYSCGVTSPAYLAALQALTRFAFFTGVGYQTARGMGLTQTLIRK